MKLKISKPIAIVLLIFAIFTATDILWLTFDNMPPAWDESLHLTKSLQYYSAMRSFDFFPMIDIDNYYPPLYHLSTVIPYFIFGNSMDSAITINIFYYLILLFSAYGITSNLHSKQAGVITTLLISLYPVIIGMKRYYLIEIALISMVALAIYCLIKTQNFTNRKYSLLFGISISLAILTKWTAIFFISPPVLIILYNSFKTKSPEVGDFSLRTLNIITVIFSSLLISLIWYAPHISEVYKQIAWGNEFWGASEGDPEVFTISSLIYYIPTTISAISFFLFIPFLFSLRRKPNYLLLSWIIVPYIVMTLLHNKNDRYVLPFITPIAIMSAMWITETYQKTDKSRINSVIKGIINVILVIGVLQIPYLALGEHSDSPIFPKQNYGTAPPKSEDWHIDNALSKISKDSQKNPRIQNRVVIVGVLSDMPYVNGLTYQYTAYSKGYPFQVVSIPYFEAVEPFLQNFPKFDYLVLKTGTASGDSRKQLVSDLYAVLDENSKYYQLIAEYSLPDNSTLQVRRDLLLPEPEKK